MSEKPAKPAKAKNDLTARVLKALLRTMSHHAPEVFVAHYPIAGELGEQAKKIAKLQQDAYERGYRDAMASVLRRLGLD